MKLYYFPGACSLAGHIVLEWIGAPYETVKPDLAGTKSPAYLALNPNGARIFAVIYFAFFFLMPWYSKADQRKPVPDRVTYHAH